MRAAVLVLAGCGRVAFDPLADGRAMSDIDGPSFAGLVAYWPFDTASGATIPDVVGAHDAACAGTACPSSVPGHRGPGYLFDGVDDCVTVPDPGVFQLSRFTLSLWASQSITQSGSHISKLVGPPSGQANSWQIESGNGSGYPLDGASFTTKPNGYLWSAPSALKIGQWQHLAASFDGTNLVLYVDGAVVASATSGDLTYDAGAVWIGCDDNGEPTVDENYQGVLDEVQIYNRALSPGEIQVLATS